MFGDIVSSTLQRLTLCGCRLCLFVESAVVNNMELVGVRVHMNRVISENLSQNLLSSVIPLHNAFRWVSSQTLLTNTHTHTHTPTHTHLMTKIIRSRSGLHIHPFSFYHTWDAHRNGIFTSLWILILFVFHCNGMPMEMLMQKPFAFDLDTCAVNCMDSDVNTTVIYFLSITVLS